MMLHRQTRQWHLISAMDDLVNALPGAGLCEVSPLSFAPEGDLYVVVLHGHYEHFGGTRRLQYAYDPMACSSIGSALSLLASGC